ncbi:type I-E CRISPR-associated protein Cse1/CasA [Streptomyces xanthochromogenes]
MGVRAGFDLRKEPWISVRVGGVSLRIGLRESFHRAGEVEDVELPVAPAASGLLRILGDPEGRNTPAPAGRTLPDLRRRGGCATPLLRLGVARRSFS